MVGLIPPQIEDSDDAATDVSDTNHLLDPLWFAADFLSVAGGKSSGITFHFRNTHLCPASVAHILTIPRALAKFSYDRSFDSEHLDLPGIGRALLPLQSSLQVLWLGCQNYYRNEPRFTIGTLRKWPNLRTVSCSLVALLSGRGRPDQLRLEDVLPTGLQVLEILWDKSWSLQSTVEIVLGLLSRKYVVLPGLKSITVLKAVRNTDEISKGLQLACHAVGVEFVGRQTGYN